MMVMRVGGLATGMDIEQIVNRLMDAERIPLRRMEQDRTMLTWKQEAFRDLNLGLSELDQMMLDMKLSRTYGAKDIRSTQEGAVTATGGSQTTNGTYRIEVKQLARTAINVGQAGVDIDEVVDLEGPIIFYTFNADGTKQTHEIEVEAGDTVGQILQQITNGDSPVRAFIDGDGSNTRVILETTRTGQYNTTNEYNGREIGFDEGSFFTEYLKMTSEKSIDGGSGEVGGTNAVFTYNDGLEIESKENSYTINRLNLQFHDVTNGHATLSITNNVDHTFDKIMDFVNKYNDVIEKLNTSQQERRYRDYPPLTEEQKDEMSDSEIERWEERAKSGIISGERVIVDGMMSMRRGWYNTVKTDGQYRSITEIGISTSANYLDGGQLIVDEEKLREALQDNPQDVQKLFAGASGEHNGIIHKLEEAVKQTMSRIHDHAGRATSTFDNYALGKRKKSLDEQIDMFQRRLMQVENRYWNQFTQMEKAIQQMNEQSSYLFSQFGNM